MRLTCLGPAATIALLVAFARSGEGAEPAAPQRVCKKCGWKPPETKDVISIGTKQKLSQTLRSLKANTTVLLEDGDYTLDAMADLGAAGLVLRGKSGDPAKVVLHGANMAERSVGVGVSISAPNVTVADITIKNVGYHGLQVRGERGASRAFIHNVRVADTGQQLLKGSIAPDATTFADDCTVACSTFEYTDTAPGDYTNGVDVLAGKGWLVRDSVFRNIRGPKGSRFKAGPAILFWANSQNNTVERNLIVDCYRGIALGLGPGVTPLARGGEKSFDHQGGTVRNNVIVNLNPWADEGIEGSASKDCKIEHNTVFVEGQVPWSISLRFTGSTGNVQNNLSNRDVALRDGAVATLVTNVTKAQRSWFVDVAKADLRIRQQGTPAANACQPIPDIQRDFDGKPRAAGSKPDAGAFEGH